MPVEFEFTVNKDVDFAELFAKQFQRAVVNNQVSIPPELGKGFIKEIGPSNGISLCIHQYYLEQAFVLKSLESGTGDMLTVKFTRNGFCTDQKQIDDSLFYKESHSAEIITNNLFTQAILPQSTNIDFVVMNISRNTLISLLQLDDEKASLKEVILNNLPLFFMKA